MSARFGGTGLSKHVVSMTLVAMFTLQLLVPVVSASGMQSCIGGGTCDTYDHSDDMTPHRQDWVEGTYVFDLISTSSIELELTWAVREFERDSLGLGSGTTIGDTLEDTDGLDANDGAPADLIRHTFDAETAGAGSPTVGQKLKTEVHNAIQDALESGFGTVTSLSTQYITSFTSGGQTTTCSTDSTTDAQAEGAPVNNVFEPPLCFQATASVDLLASNFNLVGSENLDLERTYRGLLTMGAEINTSFDLTTKPGHKADFVINPSSYATVLGTDVNGTLLARAGPPSHMAAEWSMNHLLAAEPDGDKVQRVDLRLGHRNSSASPTVFIEEGSKAIDLNLVIDLSDEYAATIDFAAGVYYLDTETLNRWGINMFEVSSSASVPVITADGIRLAYHNDIVDLTQFTNQFPVGDIVEGLGNTIAGVGDITMSDLEWVSVTDGTGIFESAGGLNHSHSTGCTEPVAAGQVLHYCLEGPNAMDETYPIYLQTTSQPFSMRFIDIIIAQVDDDDSKVVDFLENVQASDLERLMNAGFSIEALIGESFLNAVDLSGLPPADLTVEIILPDWVTTVDGTSTITLTKSLEAASSLDLSLTGLDPYDWEHEITDEDGRVLCYANQSTCVESDVALDLSSVNFNEWSGSFSVTMALDAELSIYRIGFVNGERCIDEPDIQACGQMEAFPSDLLRLIIDLSSRMDDPLDGSVPIPWCENDEIKSNFDDCDDLQLEATRQGMKDLANRLGVLATDAIHGFGTLASEDDDNPFGVVDLSAFELITGISGIEAPDEIVSDDEPIVLSLRIPKVRFTIGTADGWSDLSDGNPEDIQLSIVTSSIQSVFHQPLQTLSDVMTRALRSSIIGGDGLTYPPTNEETITLSTGPVDTNLPTEYEGVESPIDGAAYTGPITFTLPRGVTLVDASSSAGNLIITEDGGRQTITYIVPPGEFEDDLTFRIQVGWLYFLIQFWVYPTIVLLLVVMFVRRRRLKKKKKKAAMANRQAAVTKAQLGDHEFADLAGFASPALRHGETIEDMAYIDELSR
ncbi:MAG: hypothetical protein VXX34_04410 [Candidatus Thermoplasmatota archaeon]|nr:hypothetical protein [Candidatus Thermoplasmatota archaeon]MEE2647930.1 hypothetical protein [Candidatus Thermoplasmatota archaeon]